MKNFGLFVCSVVLSLLLAYPFGHLTRGYFPLGMAGFIVSETTNEFTNGLFFAYLLIVPIIFGLWAQGEKWVRVAIATVPVLVLSYFVGLSYLAWAAMFFAAGIIILGVVKVAVPKKRGV